MARPKRQLEPGEVNDQGEIIEFIKEGKFYSAWERVKYVGYNIVPDMEDRLSVCRRAFKKFDPYKNNNFIMFYKQYLKFFKTSSIDEEHYNITSNQTVINALKTDYISPSNEHKSVITDIKRIITNDRSRDY